MYGKAFSSRFNERSTPIGDIVYASENIAEWFGHSTKIFETSIEMSRWDGI